MKIYFQFKVQPIIWNRKINEETGKKKKTIKTEYRNTLGISGGKFTKTDMFMTIVENNEMSDFWTKHCKLVKSDVLVVATIPKPYEDVNDAFLIYNFLKK